MSVEKERYHMYLESPQWQGLRFKKLWTHPYCSCCGEYKCILQCHHHKYPPLPEMSNVSHLQVLCKDCHNLVHRMFNGVHHRNLEKLRKRLKYKKIKANKKELSKYRKYHGLKKISGNLVKDSPKKRRRFFALKRDLDKIAKPVEHLNVFIRK